eukprot:TRINITY_DN12706_c0_g1_i7.p1 TRINITY_DN12706_c0_g1~~TRINITY_DN12706_c0_g1_i7.p1  ORF type:complete len:287 (+),score=74.05 TRINITY_DN12706_c0_g1_i7:431-1291(+)
MEKIKKDAKNLELMDGVVLNKERLVVKLRNELNASNRLVEEHKAKLQEATGCIKKFEDEMSALKAGVNNDQPDLSEDINKYKAQISELGAQLKGKEVIISEMRNKQANDLSEIAALKKMLLEAHAKAERNRSCDMSQYKTSANSKSLICDNCMLLREQVVESDKRQKKYKDKLQKRLKEFDIVMTYIQDLLGDVQEHKEIAEFVQKMSKRSEELKRWFDNIEAVVSKLKESKRQHSDLIKLVADLLEDSMKKKLSTKHSVEVILFEELKHFFKMHKKCYLPINYQS